MAAAVSMQGYDEGKLVDAQKAVQGQGNQMMEGQEILGGEKEDGWMIEDDERGGAAHRVLDGEAIMQVPLESCLHSSLTRYSKYYTGVTCGSSLQKQSHQSRLSHQPPTFIPGRPRHSNSSTAVNPNRT